MLFVKSIGSRLSGSRTAYAYLARTIPRFYPPEELADIMRQAGFNRALKSMPFGHGQSSKALPFERLIANPLH